MKNIYIIKTYSKTIPSKIVKLFTRYEYSHVLISLDDGFNKMYSFGRKNLKNPFKGGFIIEDVDGEFYKKFKNTKCCVTKLSIEDKKFYDLNKNIKLFVKNKNKYKYDFIGLILRFINIDIRFNNKYVCSQFVAEVLENSNIYKFNKKIELIEPRDFDYLENGYDEYIGLIKNLKLKEN